MLRIRWNFVNSEFGEASQRAAKRVDDNEKRAEGRIRVGRGIRLLVSYRTLAHLKNRPTPHQLHYAACLDAVFARWCYSIHGCSAAQSARALSPPVERLSSKPYFRQMGFRSLIYRRRLKQPRAL